MEYLCQYQTQRQVIVLLISVIICASCGRTCCALNDTRNSSLTAKCAPSYSPKFNTKDRTTHDYKAGSHRPKRGTSNTLSDLKIICPDQPILDNSDITIICVLNKTAASNCDFSISKFSISIDTSVTICSLSYQASETVQPSVIPKCSCKQNDSALFEYAFSLPVNSAEHGGKNLLCNIPDPYCSLRGVDFKSCENLTFKAVPNGAFENISGHTIVITILGILLPFEYEL